MADSLYNVGIRVSADFAGFTSPVQQGLQTLLRFQQVMQGADAMAARFAPRLKTYFASMEQAAARTGLAYDKTQASLGTLLSSGGLTAQNMQAHAAAMGELTTAQAALSAETGKYNALLAEQQAATARVASEQKAMMGIMGGAAAFGIGMMGLGAIKSWVNDAKEMQDALVQVGSVAQGTQAQLTALYNQSFNVAGKTQFSAPQVLDMEKIMAVHGFTDPTGTLTQRQVISQAIPYFAQAAEIEYRMKGVSYEDSVAALTQQAHMFGNYTGKALQNNVQLAVRAGLSSGMSPDQQTNTLRYLMPAIRGFHLPSIDAYALTALANQTGLTLGRGGSNLGALFRYLTPGGSKAHQQALDEIQRLGGGEFFNAQGNFAGFTNFQRIVANFERNAPSDIVRQNDLNKAFMVQGAQAATALSTPNARKQYEAIVKRLEPYDPIKNPTGYASLQDMQLKLNQTLVGQLNTLNTNMHSMGAMLGKELVPDLTKAAHAAVQFTNALMHVGQAHPFLVKTAALFGAIATAAGLIGGPILAAASAISLMGGATVGFAAALGTATTVFGVFGAGIAAYALLFADWHDVMKVIGGDISHLSLGAVALAEFLASLFAPFLTFIDLLRGAYDIWQKMFGKPHPPAMPTTGKPNAADVWQNGEWMRPHVINGQRILLPDTSGTPGNGGKNAGHTVNFTQHIHVGAGADAHHIAATSKKAAHDGMMAALGALSSGFALDANYGGYGFTSNPTLRSGGW